MRGNMNFPNFNVWKYRISTTVGNIIFPLGGNMWKFNILINVFFKYYYLNDTNTRVCEHMLWDKYGQAFISYTLHSSSKKKSTPVIRKLYFQYHRLFIHRLTGETFHWLIFFCSNYLFKAFHWFNGSCSMGAVNKTNLTLPPKILFICKLLSKTLACMNIWI